MEKPLPIVHIRLSQKHHKQLKLISNLNNKTITKTVETAMMEYILKYDLTKIQNMFNARLKEINE